MVSLVGLVCVSKVKWQIVGIERESWSFEAYKMPWGCGELRNGSQYDESMTEDGVPCCVCDEMYE